MLVLKNDAHREVLHPCRDLTQYILLNHAGWHQFARNVCRLDLKSQEIIFVCGWVKTSQWALAAFVNQGKSHEMSFSATAGSFAAARFGLSLQSQSHVSLEQRSGPLVTRQGGPSTVLPSMKNQCLFLKYYKHKTRLLMSAKVVAEASPQDARGSPEDECRDPLPSPDPKRSRIFRLFRKGHKDRGPAKPVDNFLKNQRGVDNRSKDTLPSTLSDVVEEVPPAMKV